MDAYLLDTIPFSPDLEAIRKKLHVRTGSEDMRDLAHMAGEAAAIARPRALFCAARVDAMGEDWVDVEGVRFESRVLRVNLDQAEQIYPFLCTCGIELQEWSDQIEDVVWKYWADGIKEAALFAALSAYQDRLHGQFMPGHLSNMSPGSLQDWPITQQAPLFELLGNPDLVRLTESMLMVPNKSVSGISFVTGANFESCQLCQRENCPGRRAPYDETLFAQKYCPAVG